MWQHYAIICRSDALRVLVDVKSLFSFNFVFFFWGDLMDVFNKFMLSSEIRVNDISTITL